jgi:hypothetical protein
LLHVASIPIRKAGQRKLSLEVFSTGITTVFQIQPKALSPLRQRWLERIIHLQICRRNLCPCACMNGATGIEDDLVHRARFSSKRRGLHSAQTSCGQTRRTQKAQRSVQTEFFERCNMLPAIILLGNSKHSRSANASMCTSVACRAQRAAKTQEQEHSFRDPGNHRSGPLCLCSEGLLHVCRCAAVAVGDDASLNQRV